jgi:hypothetical protein
VIASQTRCGARVIVPHRPHIAPAGKPKYRSAAIAGSSGERRTNTRIRKATDVDFFLKILFLPGNLVLKLIGVSPEEDSGILRSFINASVWGVIALLIALHYLD